MSRSKRPC